MEVPCENDSFAYLRFLIMSPDPSFHFSSGMFLSKCLKYFNDSLKNYTTGQCEMSLAYFHSLIQSFN